MIMISVHYCKIMISPGAFSIFFFLILIFWAVREVKVQKIAQHEKQQLHPIRVISKEWYGCFFQFSEILIFLGCYGGKMAKNGPK